MKKEMEKVYAEDEDLFLIKLIEKDRKSFFELMTQVTGTDYVNNQERAEYMWHCVRTDDELNYSIYSKNITTLIFCYFVFHPLMCKASV